jgi:hypothetical protein
MMSHEVLVKINQLRQIQHSRPLTIEEQKEVIMLLRENRRSAAEAGASKKAKEKKEINVADLLANF